MIYKIPLTQGKFALVDKEDVLFLCQWTWYYVDGYAVRTDKNKRTIWMHRVILERKLGHSDFKEVDHVNRNRSDNQRDNLRSSTRSQNQYNQDKYKNNISGYKGVYWNESKQKNTAEIRKDGEKIFLGYFDDPKMAARVYNIFAIKYHGEFACLNKV